MLIFMEETQGGLLFYAYICRNPLNPEDYGKVI